MEHAFQTLPYNSVNCCPATGFFHFERTEQLALVDVDGGHPGDWFCGAEPDAVVLDSMQLFQGSFWRDASVCCA